MIHIYHPNKSVKGFACSFWYSEKDSTIFATLIKQSGWDEQSQNGTFKDSLNDPTKKVNVKLDYVEAAAILDCVERNRPFKAFHDNEESPKSIAFTPWMQGEGTAATQRGYSFSITVGSKQDSAFKNSFYIGLTFAEARLIREFIVNAMHKHFNRPLPPRLNNPPKAQSKTPLTSF